MEPENPNVVFATRRATICVSVDEPAEIAALEAWLEKWRGSLAFVSQNEGCGCCLNIYRIEGPAEAIAELPENIIATDPAWH